MAFLFINFQFSGGIGKHSSAGYDRRVPEYTEFLHEYNLDGNYTHPDINARGDRLRINYDIRLTQSEWEGSEISANRMGKGLFIVYLSIISIRSVTLHSRSHDFLK